MPLKISNYPSLLCFPLKSRLLKEGSKVIIFIPHFQFFSSNSNQVFVPSTLITVVVNLSSLFLISRIAIGKNKSDSILDLSISLESLYSIMFAIGLSLKEYCL